MRAPQQTVSVPVRSVARGSCEEVQTQTSQSARMKKCHTLLGTGCCWIEHRQMCRLCREEQLLFTFLYLCHCKPGFGCRGLCAKCRGIPRRKTARFPEETNATWSSDGRWRWNLAPRSQRPWTYSVSWMRGADGSDASPEEFLAERRQASSRDKCAMKQ